MLLYYIRHADPIYNPDSITELGKKQAEALSKRLSLYGLDEVYSSSSVRAQMTAAPTLKALGLKLSGVFDWAHEGVLWKTLTVQKQDDSGGIDWAFRTPPYVEIFNSDKIRDFGLCWYDNEYFKNTKFKEALQIFNKNADEFFLTLGYRHDKERHCFIAERPNDKRVAFFAHQGVGMAFLSNVLDIPYPLFSTHFDFGHSSVSVIEFKEVDGMVFPRVLQCSNDSHLYKEGVLTGYQNEIDI